MKSGDAYWIKIKSVRGETFYSTLDKGNDFDRVAGDIQSYTPPSYIRENTWECGLSLFSTFSNVLSRERSRTRPDHMKALGINPFYNHCYNFDCFIDILLQR